VEWARHGAAGTDNPWQVALALERFVYERIETADFQQVFSSARQTAESGQGDCTEHAVLLAALLRARGIGARGAMGLVYVPDRRGFLYHMWTEAWIGGHWMPLDATRGQGGTGVGHLKLSDSLLTGGLFYDGLMPLIEAIGRLKIELIEVE
jgi:transglutaminase-like putative cysteine protease